MREQPPKSSEEKLLALPQGENPQMAWTEILLRTVGMPGFHISIGGGHSRVRQWIHADPYDPDDPYRYLTREPDLRWVSLDYYVGWWRRGKEWYPDLSDWIDAKGQIQSFLHMDVRLADAYRERHTRGGKRYIKLAQSSIEAAPDHLGGFRRDHAHRTEFNRTSKGPYADFLKTRYGITIDPNTLPDRPPEPLNVPEHRGMKQLAILLDKLERSDEAIEVCRQAIQIGWPGDWETRIDRYTKRIQRQARGSTPPHRNVKRSIAKFCTQCGEPLDPSDLFCGSCGTRRK